ncbi:lysine decarboxylase [Sneathiella chinensis]|uniref:Lysine decarboxylase n=1 Tax=Sneathiella chinensis TaxID=349750 RepID=A0ABQ5U8K0_9PROT|nr:lysine decarboxylase [Sneathiella chinensis]
MSGGVIYTKQGRLDPWEWRWVKADIPQPAEAVTPREALTALAGSPRARRIPVGVIGPREATPEQLVAAEAVGAALGQMGMTVICGGKGGVMEAVSKGCHEAGGLTVGMIPDHDWRTANPFVALPIATGLSEARNMIIAKSSAALIAVGGSYGTLSEVAYGLHFSKPVIGIAGAPAVEGVEHVAGPEEAATRLAEHFLQSAGMS